MSTGRDAVALGPEGWGPGSRPDPLSGRKHGLLGAPVPRIDGPLKVRGAARFAAEVPMEGMVYASLAFSTIPKGSIAALETSAAEKAPGVVLVMTHRNAPHMKQPPAFLSTAALGATGDELPVMQDNRIHWNGQPIALVLAGTREQADHAASLIRATYRAEPAATSYEEAKAGANEPAAFAGQPLSLQAGDAEAALAAAPYQVDVTYRTPRQNQNAIEPHAATVAWDGDELIVHDCVQSVTHEAWSLAEIFGLRQEQVHVSAPYLGGGFGGKVIWQHQILAVAAAKLAGRPVQIALSRKGVYRVVGGRTATEQRVAIGAQADGRFDALIHTGTVTKTRHNYLPEAFITSTMCLYAAGSMTLEVRAAYMDMVANAFMRAPGQAVGSFGLESAVDELAVRIGIDPIELRIRNEPDNDPTTGLPFSSRNLVQAYRAGAQRFGWDQRNPAPGARREGEWLVGMGTATANYPHTRFPGGAARIILTRDGRARVEIAAHEMGMGTATAQTQVAAERLGLPLEQVTFAYGESSFPGVVLAGGSQQTGSIGAAVIAAHRELAAELLKLAGDDSPLAGLSLDEVGTVDGGLASLSERQRWESYTEILDRAGRDEVRVNAVTGETRVSRFLGSFDCGRIINAKTAASQFRGRHHHGAGAGAHGGDAVPEIDVIWTDIPDPHTPMGARGVGEIGITGVGAAVANAVYNATGRRVRDLPITLDKLL
jgi:xanthine dehydrogenase YagR molybdenum-binding subunit